MAHWAYINTVHWAPSVYWMYTVSVHWLYTAVDSVSPVYTLSTLSNSVYSYTGATLGLHWVHYIVWAVYTASVRPAYTLTTMEFGLGFFMF